MDYNFILSLDRTNFKSHISNFKFLAGGERDFVKGQNFSSFLLDSDWVLRGLVYLEWVLSVLIIGFDF